MNMSEIRFKTSFIIDIFYGLRLCHLLFQFNTKMYTSGIHFHALFGFCQSRFQFNTKIYTSGIHFRAPFGFANHDSSSTRKCIPAVYIFVLLLVPPIMIPVQLENVQQRYTFSCSFQSNKYTFLRASRATLLCLGASLWVLPH